MSLGNIGKKVARRVQGFDMDVRYYDILRLTEDQEDALGVRFALFNELLRTSDIVTLHVPLNDITRRMMSTAQFAMVKRTAILINTRRGPVVGEDALHRALTSGTIAAAGLDVMVDEPPKKNHPLFSLPNVTLTPQLARLSWAALLKRVFAVDLLLCSRCGGHRRLVAVYPGGQRRRDLLDRLQLSEPPGLPPPQGFVALDPRHVPQALTISPGPARTRFPFRNRHRTAESPFPPTAMPVATARYPILAP